MIDATQWHNWAVEWTPTTITGYVDGVAWFSTTRPTRCRPGPCTSPCSSTGSPAAAAARCGSRTMQVDWVRYYPVDGSGTATAITTGERTPPRHAVAGTTTPPHRDGTADEQHDDRAAAAAG